MAENPMQGFFQHVTIDPVSRCWNWTGLTDNASGCGVFHGKPANRVLYHSAIREIPEYIEVFNRCGNAGCVNPDHLSLKNHHCNDPCGLSELEAFEIRRHGRKFSAIKGRK